MTNLSEVAAAGTAGGDSANKTSPSTSSTEQPPGDTLLNTVAGVMGNVLEWYDFALFGFFSDTIATNFFPVDDTPEDHDNLIKSFVIFGSAFLMRPIGGILIGYVGDKYGRKEALTQSLYLMAIPTTIMGCLPTYEQVGVLSTVLLCLCRLTQGISVGGQLPASLIYTVEKRPREQWGYYGSLPMMAANVGTLLGNLGGALMRQLLTDEQLLSWGWRIPFFSGTWIATVAWYLRKNGTDGVYDPAGSTGSAEDHNPLKVAFRRGNRLALLSTSIVPMLWAAGFYVSFVWMSIFMGELMNPPMPHAFWINSVGLLLGMTWIFPIAGALSDRVGRVPLMTVSGLLLTVLGPVFLVLISRGNVATAVASQLMLGVLLSFYGGPLCAWLVENFSPEVRMTSASIGYDLSHAIAGGFSPAIATILYTNAGVNATGLVYVIFGLLSVAGLYINYCFGRGDKEADTGAGSGGAVEMQAATTNDDSGDAPAIANETGLV
mmetsp:Transcript_10497/g.30693  ORF Transcript_10497/g.30693 Transcript_10497/m.30693 type:complete len:491 (-) Transcript_10497:515-1987(-)